MIKEILILLWILIIPLIITVRRLFQTAHSISLLPKEKRRFSFNDKMNILPAIIFLWLIFCGTFPVFRSYGKSLIEIILMIEIIFFDLYCVIPYISLGKNKIKVIFVFLLTFINFLTSELWVIQGNLSSTVIWISIISYPMVGLYYVLSYYLERWKS